MLTQSEIVSEIVGFGLHGMGIGQPPNIEALGKLSLQDMLDAVRQVERDNEAVKARGGTYSFQVVPDDRLTAAVYTWLHYCGPGNHDAGDPDDAILHLKVGDTRHGLVKWARRSEC